MTLMTTVIVHFRNQTGFINTCSRWNDVFFRGVWKKRYKFPS